MSIQFGRWNLDGSPIDPNFLGFVKRDISSAELKENSAYVKSNVGILYFPFHTTKESLREVQPHLLSNKAVLTWDGRLDNRREILRELNSGLTLESSDVVIVATAYERWATNSFSKLIGDWALSVWDPTANSLILAKDPIGARALYYVLDDHQVTWSTVLDPLVRLAGKDFALDEEYIAGWFSFYPAVYLSPYRGIHSVAPSTTVRISPGKHSTSEYWNFDPRKKLQYHNDADYEDHFRVVFAQSVERRLRSDSPILAELSGGLDSSSIVCMADAGSSKASTGTSRVDTVSYYDDSEPNWNERPYFTKIEEKRGRTGFHIDVSSGDSGIHDFESTVFAATPGSAGNRSTEASRQFSAFLTSERHRVLLSGIGGDEVAGGVPTPAPELADLMVSGRLGALASQLKSWALSQRRPWLHLLIETGREFWPLRVVGLPNHMRPAAWLHPTFVRRHRDAFAGYGNRLHLFGPLPSFQENLSTLQLLRRQLHSSPLPSRPLYEKRYPYLDRDLLEFLYAIPRAQLVRPGQRRSLVRRALVGIVPDEVLNRRRKGFVIRSPLKAIANDWTCLFQMSTQMVSAQLGIVDIKAFREALDKARHGDGLPIGALMRTIQVESWLRHLRDRGLLRLTAPDKFRRSERVSPSLKPHGKYCVDIPDRQTAKLTPG